MGSEWEGGKGDTPRKVDRVKFENNWNAIFGKNDHPMQTDLFEDNIERPLAIGETLEQRALEDLQHDWELMRDHILSTNNHDVLSKLRNK